VQDPLVPETLVGFKQYDEKANVNMTKQPLQELFDAMYHGKPSFHDFLHSPMPENYEILPPRAQGKRKIVKPKENLKIYHKFLNLFLVEFLPINEQIVFSYRKGFGAVNAVEKHKHGRYFFQTDVSSFFESIDTTLIKSTILAGANYCPISDIHLHIDRIIELACLNDSLPIGFPVSAPLSNCVLFTFDNEMERICQDLEMVYSRYADDIIISGQTQHNLSHMESIVQEKLHTFASKKFNINKGKTKFFQVGSKVKILGMMVLPNGKITPDTKKKREIEFLLHFYLTDRAKFNKMIAEMKARPGKEVEVHEDEYPAVLTGNLNYVDSIDPDYTNKLRRKFGAATIDMLMHTGFTTKK
jgi:RNA-directed DNA polymerase